MLTKSFHKLLQLHRLSVLVLSHGCRRTFSEDGQGSERVKEGIVNSNYDVIIAGGGMVGTAAAVSLALSPKFSNKKILLIEAATFRSSNDFSGVYSNRVSALSPATKEFMKKVGAWEHVENNRYNTIRRMQVWDACSDALISFTGHKESTQSVAYTVENNLVVHSFLKVLENHKDRVTVLDAARVDSYKLPTAANSANLVEVVLKNGQTFNAKLLIGADGWRSAVRNAMNINYINWPYNQMGVVATTHLAESTNNCVAWQRFLPESTICLLPLTDTLSSLVWSTSISHAKKLLNMDEQSFISSINEAFWSDEYKIPQINSILKSFSNLVNGTNSNRQFPPSVLNIDKNSRAGFILGFGHASNYVGYRVALVGDAAHRVHPHAGQGVNLGFADVESLCNVLEEAVSCGSDIGSLYYLMKFETERQRRIAVLMAAIDGIHRLYKTDWKPLVLIRSLGLQSVNAMDSAKNYIMTSAVQ